MFSSILVFSVVCLQRLTKGIYDSVTSLFKPIINMLKVFEY